MARRRLSLLLVASRSTQQAAFKEAERRVALIRDKFTQDVHHYVKKDRRSRGWLIYVERGMPNKFMTEHAVGFRSAHQQEEGQHD